MPKTAITNLEPIIQGALKDKAYAEAVKAIGKKITLEGNIQGNKPEEKITRLEAEIAKAPKEMVPLMDTLLAEWYWQYFQQNRWRFMQRTATATPPGKDFTTWDLPRLFAEIDKQFQKALAAEKILKATPIGAWDDLLQKGDMPDSYRPTLYDFIAHQALQFYTSGEQAAAKPEGAFELPADSPVLDAGREVPGAGSLAAASRRRFPVLKAIRLYQACCASTGRPCSPVALADADLERLTWAWNTAFGEDKDARYKAALEAFHPLLRGRRYFRPGAGARGAAAPAARRPGRRHKLALRGAEAFPDSPGGKLCRNLITAIEAKSASITTERVWNCNAAVSNAGPCPTINVRYCNVQMVYFRAIPVDWEAFLGQRGNRWENLNDRDRRDLLTRKPALEWSVKLPPTADYKEKTFKTPAPASLKPGYYFIGASHNPTFSEENNVVSLTDVWVSTLALVTRTGEGKIGGFVLNGDSGEPISGAQVSVWHYDNQGALVADPALTTDAERALLAETAPGPALPLPRPAQRPGAGFIK